MEINVIFRSLEIDQQIIIQSKFEDKLSTVIDKFAQKLYVEPKDFFYYYAKKEITNKDLTIMKLLNYSKNVQHIEIGIKKRTKIIKCPICACNNCILHLDNYRLNFSECCHGHSESKLFEEYEDTQRINYQKIKCDNQCGRTQKDSLEDFHKCLKCSNLAGYAIYYCNQCNDNHKHKTIKYDEKYYYCTEHSAEYVSYCVNCVDNKNNNINLCENCEKKHKGHEIKKFDTIIPDVKEIKKKLEKINEKIDELKIIVRVIKNKMDDAVKIVEKYYEIANDMINKYETFNSKLKNYQVLLSINYLSKTNKEIIKDIDNVIKGNKNKEDWKKKCNKLIDIIEGDRSVYKNENSDSVENETNDISKEESKNMGIDGNNMFSIPEIYEKYSNISKNSKGIPISINTGNKNGKNKSKGMIYNKSNITNK